jgi:hypothetical protein
MERAGVHQDLDVLRTMCPPHGLSAAGLATVEHSYHRAAVVDR